jgi:hypothetical protein
VGACLTSTVSYQALEDDQTTEEYWGDCSTLRMPMKA